MDPMINFSRYSTWKCMMVWPQAIEEETFPSTHRDLTSSPSLVIQQRVYSLAPCENQFGENLTLRANQLSVNCVSFLHENTLAVFWEINYPRRERWECDAFFINSFPPSHLHRVVVCLIAEVCKYHGILCKHFMHSIRACRHFLLISRFIYTSWWNFQLFFSFFVSHSVQLFLYFLSRNAKIVGSAMRNECFTYFRIKKEI